MNEWMWTAFALTLCLVPCLVVCLRGEIRIPAHTPEIWMGIVSACAAVLLAAYTVFAARRDRPSLPARALNVLAAGLRPMHSGIVCDYVAWFTCGVAALGVAATLLLR